MGNLSAPPDPTPGARERSARPGSSALFTADEHQPFAFDFEGEVGALLVHGFAGTPAEMRPLGEALVDIGIGAYGPLLPGFGAELHRLGDVDASHWLEAAGNAWHMVRRRYRTALLIGFSLGGALSLQLAARWPPARLILLAPVWRPLGPVWPAGALLPLACRVVPSFAPFRGVNFTNPSVRAFFARAAADLNLDDPRVQAAVRHHTRLPTRSFLHLWRVAMGVPAAARLVDAPTMFIQGRRDWAVRPHDTRALRRKLRGPTTLHEVDAGHLLTDPRGPAWDTVRSLVLAYASETQSAEQPLLQTR
jgi:carboxylesterase